MVTSIEKSSSGRPRLVKATAGSTKGVVFKHTTPSWSQFRGSNERSSKRMKQNWNQTMKRNNKEKQPDRAELGQAQLELSLVGVWSGHWG